jgi:hypothetical protein
MIARNLDFRAGLFSEPLAALALVTYFFVTRTR